MGQIKILRKIYLPLVVGQSVECIREDGAKIKTTPKNIDGIICREKGLEITFTTANSIYRGLVPMASPLAEYVVGQELIPGRRVVNTSNEQEIIEQIQEIRTDGVITKTKTGIYKGLVKLA